MTWTPLKIGWIAGILGAVVIAVAIFQVSDDPVIAIFAFFPFVWGGGAFIGCVAWAIAVLVIYRET
jgi:hypothetical protein